MYKNVRLVVTLFCLLLGVVIQLQAQQNAYHEKQRLQFHFSPPAHWMNDPNGMVYYEGEYHLFYQYYPNDIIWGPMHWGHAVSKDLVYWKNLPIALYPDSLGLIFSGSAVVDWKNTSGFGKNGQAPMLAMFTHHSMEKEKKGSIDVENQSLAYSNDRGRTWTKYTGNPVIPNPGIRDFRDTKVFWHEKSKQWVVVLAAQTQVQFYASPNLKDWKLLSSFGADQGSHSGVWECPDMFPLQVPGSKEEKWVLLVSLNAGSPNGGSGTQYFVGNFDGKQFSNDNPADKVLWLEYGRDNYAGVTWSNAPDGRRIFLGWMSNWEYATKVPTTPWRSANTLARELSLQTTPLGLRVNTQPVANMKKLRERSYSIPTQTISSSLDLSKTSGLVPTQLEVELEVKLPVDSKVNWGLELRNGQGEKYRIGFDAVKNQFFSDRQQAGNADFSAEFAKKIHVAPRESQGRLVKMHLFFDVSSVELFADEGKVVLTDLFFPAQPFSSIALYAEGGSIELVKGQMWALKGIWK
jgi:fructan beta-fructosidase